MDQLLLPYLQATDDIETQRRPQELLLFHAAPVVKQRQQTRLLPQSTWKNPRKRGTSCRAELQTLFSDEAEETDRAIA